ncbi:MAG: Ribonuclease P protein component [Candidatus Roizmanbacteria bacterium GW2011_GWB1_40_7]|uniref:Ribonuclease P protein component n=1 Tax=Candidatus Roizmanbacteria bacterium GW2011_GWB1_40_7 TaxID=1618482 RepID=A0A0G0VGQ6_9BACT|nr:MAG: Ribonuclease P protein component [Candidatus Roizmanbacteria bacterium GW2011_GWB1_40_7]
MLPKHYRLAGHRIPTLIRSGKRVSNHLVSLVYQPTCLPAGRQPTTITVIVPVRLSKKAVERNRTRRLLREAIYQHLTNLEHGHEVIVMAKKILKEEKLTDILPDITELIKNAGLLK